MIDITGLDKAEVLAALYNASKPLGMGAFHFLPGDLPIEEARELTKGRRKFEYVHGRVLKVDISGDEFDEYFYDRDNGDGAAARAVVSVRQGASET